MATLHAVDFAQATEQHGRQNRKAQRICQNFCLAVHDLHIGLDSSRIRYNPAEGMLNLLTNQEF